ncbi:preprotein translocase subunit SecG [Variovorax paradoxus]|nr:hypothetical protein [Variovorax paradoxus]MDQ0571519.1 preprotein translocase subunit SecG [Variovorax paradoxus]
MNPIHNPVGDNRDAADEMPSASFATVLTAFFAIIFVVTGLVAAVIHGLP